MTNKTVLYDIHVALGGKMVDFAGWEMPIHYGSQIEEHHAVRNSAGVFDVSHMGTVEIQGEKSRDFLSYLLANDIHKLKTSGKALYTCMLNEEGGIIDDMIVYYLDPNHYRIVVNAGTCSKDLAWMRKQAKVFGVQVTLRDDVSILAVQGPEARAKVHAVLMKNQRDELVDLQPFQGIETDEFWIARTGYTGEEGYEIILPKSETEVFWNALLAEEVRPCGLGARDTLRLEAGLNLYGSDMDETTSPLESNLSWTVVLAGDRAFIGKETLVRQQKTLEKQLVGLVLEERGVLRSHQPVMLNDEKIGEVTSGTFSPTMGKAIGFARINKLDTKQCKVEIRGKQLPAKIVKTTFVKNGKILID